MYKTIVDMFPRGRAWFAKLGAYLDTFYRSLGDVYQDMRDDIGKLAYLSDPEKTCYLEDLEKEYGIATDTNLTDDERIANLKLIVYNTRRQSSEDTLQQRLATSGFSDLFVYKNDPAVDPRVFLESTSVMYADGENAYAGDENAFAARFGGQLLVNGNLSQLTPNYSMMADSENGYAGDENAVAGYFERWLYTDYDYEITGNSDYWPLVFFVGGAADRDPVTNEIIFIEYVNIRNRRRQQLERLIMQFKPLHTWCITFINYV